MPPAPSERREGASLVPWGGCPLTPLGNDVRIQIPDGVEVTVKIDLLGWEKMGSVPQARLKKSVPFGDISPEMTADDVHRRWGAIKFQARAYTTTANGRLDKPLASKTWSLQPGMFTTPDYETDPSAEQPEEDIGDEAWPVSEEYRANDTILAKEIRRRDMLRAQIEQENAAGDDGVPQRFDVDSDGPPGYGPAGYGDPGRGHGGASNLNRWGQRNREPEWVFETTYPTMPPGPGARWAYFGNPMKWQQVPMDGAPAPSVVTAPAPEKPGMDPDIKNAVISLGTTVLAMLVKKMTDAPPPAPDPMVGLATMMTALRQPTPAVDAVELKRIELEAEEKREARANAERRAAAEAAEASRKHEMELQRIREEAAERRMKEEREAADRRAKEEREATERRVKEEREIADRRAKEERDARIAADEAKEAMLLRMRVMGLSEKPQETAAERNAHIDREVRLKTLELQLATKTNTSPVEAMESAKKLLSSLGVKLPDGTESPGMLVEFMNSELAKGLAPSLLPQIQSLVGALSTALGGQPQPQPPVQGPPVHIVPNPAPQLDPAQQAQMQAQYQQQMAQAAQIQAAQAQAIENQRAMAQIESDRLRVEEYRRQVAEAAAQAEQEGAQVQAQLDAQAAAAAAQAAAAAAAFREHAMQAAAAQAAAQVAVVVPESAAQPTPAIEPQPTDDADDVDTDVIPSERPDVIDVIDVTDEGADAPEGDNP